MKHYIEIENVGPIKKAKIDLSKYVVLIGPQASGKSIIAKLIAIFRSEEFRINRNKTIHSLFKFYGIFSFFNDKSVINYYSYNFYSRYIHKDSEKTINLGLINVFDNKTGLIDEVKKIKKDNKPSIYIPADRIIISLLSQSIYSIIQNKINLPQLLLDFAANYEKARNEIKEYNIKFLKANYHYKNGKEILEINKQETPIAEAASGFQTLIPMLLVCEYYLKDKLSQTYIIEEPELNLFPTAQKDLIYHLINIINDSYSKEQNTTHDLIITTHSPYILASLNNLLLAGKIKDEQNEKFTKAKKIVNGDFYITKNDLNVYALKNGKAKNIISKETGLISENELDNVSEEINYEFNALKDLYFESAN